MHLHFVFIDKIIASRTRTAKVERSLEIASQRIEQCLKEYIPVDSGSYLNHFTYSILMLRHIEFYANVALKTSCARIFRERNSLLKDNDDHGVYKYPGGSRIMESPFFYLFGQKLKACF